MIRSMVCRVWVASEMDIPGSAVGIKRIEPSFRGGINSLPNCRKGMIVISNSNTAPTMTPHRKRAAKATTGRYAATSHWFNLLRSARILPRISHTARAGTRVMDRNAANAME